MTPRWRSNCHNYIQTRCRWVQNPFKYDLLTMINLSFICEMAHVCEGDDAHLIVWNLLTGKKVQDISCVFHSPITCIQWIKSGQGDKSFVFGGTERSLQIYKQLDHNICPFQLHCFIALMGVLRHSLTISPKK